MLCYPPAVVFLSPKDLRADSITHVATESDGIVQLKGHSFYQLTHSPGECVHRQTLIFNVRDVCFPILPFPHCEKFIYCHSGCNIDLWNLYCMLEINTPKAHYSCANMYFLFAFV